MKFLIDVRASSLLLQETLVSLGHDVLSVRDGHNTASDDELLSLAHSQERVLVTKDKDFGELVFLRRLPHSCIVRGTGMSVHQEAEALTSLIQNHPDALFEDTLIVVSNDHIRIRRSPIGD